MSKEDRAPRRLVVHASNPEIGGAEASLLAELEREASAGWAPVFLVPAEGALASAARARGWEARVLPWPRGFASLTQSRGFAPLLLPGFIRYLARLAGALRGAGRVRSSGVKSHAACLALSPWLGGRLVFDLRDFIRTPPLRRALAFAGPNFGCRFLANSKAVASDYPGAEVRYPRVSLVRPAVDRREPSGRRIITHLAFFAPYKGQDLFLRCARALLDAGVDAEFRLIGDVIYPAPAYARYRDSVRALAAELGLEERARFLGKLPADEVQRNLEETHLLLHCTREPEPFGRAPMEALLCGAEAVCHGGSGVCETVDTDRALPPWAQAVGGVLGPDYVRLRLRDRGT